MSKCLQCNKEAVKHRTLCYTCRRRRVKQINPFGYFFDALKQNAKRRGIEFQLTLEQFKAFSIETEYIISKGKKSKSLTIDRINNSIGYHIDNIQVMSNRANVKKARIFYSHAHHGLRVKTVTDWSNAPPPLQPDPDCPF